MHGKMDQPGEKGSFFKADRKMRLLASAVIGVLLIGGVILAAVWSQRAYVPLFRGLSSDDMASVLGCLQEQDTVDYKVEDDDTILVRKNQRALLKAQMLAAGYPSNFISYNENAGAPETSGDRDAFLLLDLQERLSDVIEEYDNVQEAAVFIVPGEDCDSVASVVVTTANGHLSDDTAAGIRRTVNQAVDNLSAENVTIEDQDGNIYSDAE